ncbi:uncharacterized protein LOC18425099 [Amborella trichopoda]|uniref:Uncharacterized protein n=1 Tax=Amborella trichopoda TaxID=13333 RepID=W1NQQ7_AMBTC|nr:uncharacterized protein LOC18425099 [Amborella trichopoda]ERM97149.1 hypothetical protein AMTR_s00126p00114280 [Amborella trichopoda]|eukprot:XP_006829733.1 uncharacterized protein LOC18425099 [Amborella trichopoda]
MACIDMFSSDHQGGLCPRISFSNDFADVTAASSQLESGVPPPLRPPAVGDSDFEFSSLGGGGCGMVTADEIFCQGRLRPSSLKPRRIATLREELETAEEEEEEERRTSKVRWRGLLGLKKGEKKVQREVGGGWFQCVDEKIEGAGSFQWDSRGVHQRQQLWASSIEAIPQENKEKEEEDEEQGGKAM